MTFIIITYTFGDIDHDCREYFHDWFAVADWLTHHNQQGRSILIHNWRYDETNETRPQPQAVSLGSRVPAAPGACGLLASAPLRGASRP